ncbi:RHS repeat-associated core domain-containing protein [Alloalcanivorax xenomutans]
MTRTYYQTTDEAGDAVKGKLYEIRATVNGVENVLLERYTYYASGEAFGQIKQHIEFIDPSVPSRQRITHYTYKSDGINVQSKVVSGATSGGDITTTYTYDVLGRVLTETLHRRRSATDSSLMEVTTRYAYDDLDRVTKVTTPDGNIHENVYDDNGKVVEKKLHHTGSILSSECPYMSGHTVCTYAKNKYDAAGRLIKVTDVLGYSTSYTYDEMGNRLSETDPNGNTVRHEYDSMGRRTARIDANGHRFTFKYNLGGRLILATDPNGHSVRNTYDAMGRLIQVETEAGRVSQTTYDANGNITHVKDANAMADTGHPRNNEGATIYREYDELNRLVLERNALNGDTRYTYDLLGNVTSITDAEGQVTSFVYDDLGRLLETQDPVVEPGEDKTDRVLLYDEAGNPLLTEDRSGRRQRNSYDKMNRLVGADYLQDGSSYDWGYYGFGKPHIAGIDEEEEQKYYYQYTARYERKKMFDDRGGDIKDWIYSYDPAGNLATKTKPKGDVTTYQYDSMNRLVGMSNPEYLTASYHYDGAGRLIDRLLSNGAETHYQYDNDDRLVQLQSLSADGSAVEDLHYLYDHVGNIVQISDTASGRTVIYDYDALYRLVRVDSTNDAEDRAYSYDAVGNRRTEVRNGVTYHYCFDVDDCNEGPSGNRLMNIRVGSMNGPIYRQFKYDDSGRVTEKLDANGVPLYTVTYDGKGRASEINGKLFEYDHAGYRIRNGERLHYLEDEHLDSTYDLDGVLKNSYLHGVVVDELLNGFSYYSEDQNDRTNYTFHNDHLNSVSALTGHNGAVEERTTFDAFGMPLSQSMPGTENTLLYTGREYDRNSGLYYYRARYYDPEIGRFISEDPARFEGGINFYAYVGNNPINYNDPMGLVKWNDAFSSGLGMITSGAGVFVGGATAVGGGVMLGLPEPTLITKAAGVGAISFGTTTVAKSSFDFGLNFRNFVSAVRDQEAGVPSSGFELGAQVLFPGSQDAQLAAVSGNLMFDLASGRVPVGRIPDVVSAGSALARTKFANITEVADYSSANRAIGQLPVSIGSYGASDVSLGLSILQGSALAQTTLNNYGSVKDALFGGAGGGFVLYPGKPNTNLMQSAYDK